jgi:hypothetical protein
MNIIRIEFAFLNGRQRGKYVKIGNYLADSNIDAYCSEFLNWPIGLVLLLLDARKTDVTYCVKFILPIAFSFVQYLSTFKQLLDIDI